MYNVIETVKPDELVNIAKSNNYKFARMEDSSGRVLVYQNPTGDKLLLQKIKEIQQRAGVVPSDAIYYVIFKNKANGEDWAYKYIKGNPVQIQQVQPMQERGASIDYNLYASKDAEIADLRGQLDRLKLQMIYENDLNNLRQEVKQLSQPREPEKSPILGFAENVLPQFMPLLTEYLEIRKLEAQAKVNGTPAQPRRNNAPKLPIPGTPQFIAYCEALNNLSDEELDAKLTAIENINPPYANAIRQILFTDEEETETNTNTESDEQIAED